MDRIVITGMGIVSALGTGCRENLQSLAEGRSGVTGMKYLKSDHADLPVGEVKKSNDELKALLGISQVEETARTTLLGALALREAISDAGIGRKENPTLISGTTVGGMDISEKYYLRMQTDPDLAGLILQHDAGHCTEHIASLAGLEGKTCTVSTACSSALNSIILGARLLREGCEKMVVAGGSESLTRFHLNGFNTLMILDSQRCRPFDAERHGLNLGEGAAYVVLERESDAMERNAKILAYVSGFANTCDAFHQTASSPDGTGAYLAMKEALESCGLSTSDIDYINAHGTGTSDNDISESNAILRLFSEKVPYISSTKALTGHCTSSAGSVEAVLAILASRAGFIPGNMGFEHAMENGFKPTATNVRTAVSHIMCNSFGFGGNDSSVIFSFGKSAADSCIMTDISSVADDIEVIASDRIDENSDLQHIKDFVSPMESRRMGTLLKAATITSYDALEKAGIQSPDAIISVTALGMIATSEKFLLDMLQNGENVLKPTLFMQSTHNTIGSSVAIRTKCHGYNITYAEREKDIEIAFKDARMLIASGKAETVLVGYHEESTEMYRSFMELIGHEIPAVLESKSYLLRRRVTE